MSEALEVNNLCYTYPGTKKIALNDISFNIPRGSAFGLLGENGAGKTTLLSCVTKKIHNYSGAIKLFSKDISDIKDEILKVGFAPQELALYPSLTAYKNLDFFGGLSGLKGNDLIERINFVLDFVNLGNELTKKVEEYSGGMKRRLNLAVALINDPSILILDEPTVGVDPQTRNLIFEKIEELKKKGITIIYTTHYMEEVERLCGDLLILKEGRALFNGPLDRLKEGMNEKNLESCYLKLTQLELS